MRYAKFINNEIEYLQMPICTDTENIFTTDDNVIKSCDYKPVLYTQPEEREGFYCTGFEWTETDTEIVQKWQYTEIIDD